MKKILISIIITIAYLNSNAQDSLNFTSLSTWTSPDASAYNDIWGYSSNGREYAIMGSNWGTHFIDITNPQTPVEINSFIGDNSNVIWRDYKVSGNYAYGVADNFGNSLQIFDLSNLPISVTKIYDNDSLSSSSHNIFIENDRVYLPSNRNSGGINALDILDISNPTNPKHLFTMGNAYFGNCGGCLHDIYVKNDTAYCSAGTSGLYIYDLTDINNPTLISSIIGYSEAGYNHASWVDEDGVTMVMADETHGSGVKTFDLTDITNPIELDVFRTYPGAIPHNPFVRGTEAYISYYHDGMQVFDISDPSNVTQKAFYDTYPSNAPNNHGGYEGDWGVYPYFESKNIIASDISTGLYVLGKINDIYTTGVDFEVCANETTLQIPYNIKGIYNAGNIFTLELSDSNGTFKNPTVISTINSTTNGMFTANIPVNIARGNEYKVRVRSSNPAIIQGEYQKIYFHQEKNIVINTTICMGESYTLGNNTYNSTGNYNGIISGGINCDTNYTLNLQVDTNELVLTDTICEGENYVIGNDTLTTTGIFNGTLPSINNCDTTVTIDLFVNNISTPIITNNNGTLETSSGYTYQWYLNGQPISGATNKNLTTIDEGNYSVIISDGICSKSSAIVQIGDLNSIELTYGKGIKIYPNPSTGIINIENFNNEEIQIQIINSLGQIIMEKTITETTQIELKKGIYTIRVLGSENSYTKKIIIE